MPVGKFFGANEHVSKGLSWSVNSPHRSPGRQGSANPRMVPVGGGGIAKQVFDIMHADNDESSGPAEGQYRGKCSFQR